MRPAIQIENLSKMYQIGPQQEGGYRTLRETIMDAAAAPFRRLHRLVGGRTPEPAPLSSHWALHDVNFDVQPGEMVGLIGRNGAGKSTLLKVLSKITEPTSGRAVLRGRVISLLEIGTGFHQELTGRENIYLNGAILGMTRAEIQRKFDAIVAFSEIERFLDTPAKRYSSGMYVRLAFAVAAHLDPEILVVDEVLAVGDAAFQRKCLDRMHALGSGGATILFVSHNMGTVAQLCHNAVVLEQGRMIGHGPAREMVNKYLATLGERSTIDVASRQDRSGNGRARITEVRFLDGNGRPIEQALGGEPLTIRLGYQAEGTLPNVEIHVRMVSEHGHPVTMLSSRFSGDTFPELPPRGWLDCRVPEVALAQGSYLLNVDFVVGLEKADGVQAAARLNVEPGPFFPSGRTPGPENGVVLTRHQWSRSDGV